MAERRKINPGVKLALDLGPLIAFFGLYFLLKDHTFTIAGTAYRGFIIVTAIFIPLIALASWLQYRLSGHLSKMQIATLVLVVIFGGLTVWLNDDRFIKMKPTMLYLLFAGLLGFGLLRGHSYVEAVMDEALPLERAGWMILTRRLFLFFLALAVANELVWRNFSTTFWVDFKVIGLPVATFAFFMAQARLFAKYGIEEPGEGKDPGE